MSRTKAGRAPSMLVAATVVLLLGGCGVPADTPPTAITEVPYGLAQESTAPSATSQAPGSTATQVWLVRDDALVAVVAPTTGDDPRTAAAAVFRRLVSGPDDAERARGLSTALGPDVRLSVSEVSNGRAVVDIHSGDQSPSAGQLPLAVGQLVLTLTSIPGIDEVVLTAAGEPVEAPLPGGVLSRGPLRAAQYADLVERTGTTSPTTP